MNLNRHTTSLCPECYREIPALISVKLEGVTMAKTCPVHGAFESLVERDPIFYQSVSGSNTIYEGFFIDVTRRCNLRCAVCYYPLETKQDSADQFSIESLVNDCAINAHLAPFVLTGGEPTLRPDIPELVDRLSRIGKVEMLTNGIRLADPDFFDSLVPRLTNEAGHAAIHLSVHPETGKWMDTVALFKKNDVKAGSMLMVINSKDEFLRALDIAKRCGDHSLCFRIKAASRLWNEQRPPGATIGTDKVFVSDMLSWLGEVGGYQVIRARDNKSVFINVLWNGLWLMLVSWHDALNVDLLDIDCAPYYRARNGRVANFVTASLINEGMAKGWLAGQPIASMVRKEAA